MRRRWWGGRAGDLDSAAERDRVIAEALARVEREPGLVAEAWNLYTVAPLTVEFWQADESRVHTRLRYERPAADAPWERHLLWP